jgi:SAM-dependent methyltransferase
MTKTFLQVVPGLLTISFFVHFPYHADVVAQAAAPPVISRESGDFYTKIYSDEGEQTADNAADYVKIAQEAIENHQIVPRMTSFVKEFGLRKKRVLDVGAGTGYLQDLVDDYVGLDISASARSYFHKPFVQASATEMPFRDGEFDALWSIWVLEHVPKPEQALVEMRRVVKDGGLLYLEPAWNCNPWAAQGYLVRPFSDFGLKGKLIKASLPVVASPFFRLAYVVPTPFFPFIGVASAQRPSVSAFSHSYQFLVHDFRRDGLQCKVSMNGDLFALLHTARRGCCNRLI